jgi:hypothetical protein
MILKDVRANLICASVSLRHFRIANHVLRMALTGLAVRTRQSLEVEDAILTAPKLIMPLMAPELRKGAQQSNASRTRMIFPCLVDLSLLPCGMQE